MSGSHHRCRTVLRAVRRSPRLAAARSEPSLRRALRALPHRGRCARQIAAVAAGPATGARLVALAHALCPPASIVVATLEAGDVIAAATGVGADTEGADPLIGMRGYVVWPRRSDEILRRLTQGQDPSIRAAAARSAQCPPSILERLAFDSDAQVRSRVASHPGCPRWVLTALASDPDTAVQESVAGNPASPPALITALAACENIGVRGVAAGNHACPSAVIERLADDTSGYVRAGAATNPTCSAALAERLASDTDPVVRRAVARNPNTNTELLDRIIADPALPVPWPVLEAVASNPNCPQAVLATIADPAGPSNPQPQPTKALERIKSELARCSRGATWEITHAAAANAAATPQTLDKLWGNNTDRDLCATVAANPNCPTQIHEHLADTDRDNTEPTSPNHGAVRAAAAENPACPTGALERFAADPAASVRAATATNLGCPPAALSRLAADHNNRVRAAVAAHEALPPPQIKTLLNDQDPLVANAAAHRVISQIPAPAAAFR